MIVKETALGPLFDRGRRLAAARVRAGDQVRAGYVLGAVGLTGITTGPHLHFSIRRGTEPVDPRSLLPPH